MRNLLIAVSFAALTTTNPHPAHAQADPNDYTDAVATIEKIRLVSSKATHAATLFAGTEKACPIAYPDGMVKWTVDLLSPVGPVDQSNADRMAGMYVSAIGAYPAIKDKLCAAMTDAVVHWRAKHAG